MPDTPKLPKPPPYETTKTVPAPKIDVKKTRYIRYRRRRTM